MADKRDKANIAPNIFKPQSANSSVESTTLIVTSSFCISRPHASIILREGALSGLACDRLRVDAQEETAAVVVVWHTKLIECVR
jgi:hypothetical protein